MLHNSPQIEEDAECIKWTNHIYCYTPMRSAGVIDEIEEFVTTNDVFVWDMENIVIDMRKTVDEEEKEALPYIWANAIENFYKYLLTVPLMLHLHPFQKTKFIEEAQIFMSEIEGHASIVKRNKDDALHAITEFCTMCKYLDCLSWYNTNPVETPSEDTLRHYTNLISNPDYYDMMFSKEKRESPIYHMVYDTASKKVIKAVFHDGPHILEVPPQGVTFGKCKILYDNDENVFIIRPAFLD